MMSSARPFRNSSTLRGRPVCGPPTRRICLAHGPASGRRTGQGYRLPASRSQIMPLPQRFARCTEPIGGAVRQPVEPIQVLWVELYAIGHALLAVLVIDAAAIAAIE